MVRITAPVEGYKGRIGDVIFNDGVAETNDIAVIAYCQGAGYTVEGYEQQPTQVEQREQEQSGQPDSRDVETEVVGTRLRDAAVDPRPEDFLPPTAAGEADPHGPDVVAPGVHATPPAPIVPGLVDDDPDAQAARETEAAARTLAGDEPVPDVTADMAAANSPTGEVEYPAGNASTDAWRTYAVQSGKATAEEVADMGRDELRDTYGPRSE